MLGHPVIAPSNCLTCGDASRTASTPTSQPPDMSPAAGEGERGRERGDSCRHGVASSSESTLAETAWCHQGTGRGRRWRRRSAALGTAQLQRLHLPLIMQRVPPRAGRRYR